MSIQTESTQPVAKKTSWLSRPVFLNITPAVLLLVAIMLASAGFHFYKLGTVGDANTYYTAAVKSMLQSWHNFFYVAAEPGGSVTVDKPPLGLWIEAAFAAVFGVKGWVVCLPNILAGLFSIPLLYHMVRKHANEAAGLAAALVMAFTPVFVATNRNNTMDGMLVFTLLLAAYAFLKATERSSLRWLLLGGFIVGLGFNIKMLQAFLPLPAFYALYFLAAKTSWWKKLLQLGLTTVLLLVVSFAWVIAVDLTPADQRPYIGSSDDNTVMSLIFGHNGISRLELGGGRNDGNPQNAGIPDRNPQNPAANQVNPPVTDTNQRPPRVAVQACAMLSDGDACAFALPNGNRIDGECIIPPDFDMLVCSPPQNSQQIQQAQPLQDRQPQQQANIVNDGTAFSNETGEPGWLRFFSEPLSKQMSWVLPFALISLLIVLLGSRIQWPVQSGMHQGLILWGGWLLTCVVFFSMISGIFHAYYTIMLVPGLAAMVGLGFAQLLKWDVKKSWMVLIMLFAVSLTMIYQVISAWGYGENSLWIYAGIPLILLALLSLLINRRVAYGLLLAAMLVIPLFWTLKTVATVENHKLPTAYGGTKEHQSLKMDSVPAQNDRETMLLGFLEENTQDMAYLAAVPSSNQMGAQLVLASGRPVLYMGGFGGADAVVDAADLQEMVANGELRFVFYANNRNSKGGIAQWLTTSCQVVPRFSVNPDRNTSPNQANANDLMLYDCR
jgi:4-amino-4-deoxy-L-arabinose transferase-like glycosyltransferase